MSLPAGTSLGPYQIPRTLASVSDARGGTWGRDNVIVFSPSPDGVLYRVSADGGTPAPVTTLDRARQEISHRWPRFLPDGRHVLFMNRIATTNLTRYTITAVPTMGGSARPLLDAMSPGIYDHGRLLFLRDDKLFAQPFDAAAVALSGEPKLVADGVWGDGQGTAGLVGFDAAAGVLAWRPDMDRRTRMTWKRRDGTILEDLHVTDAVAAIPSTDGRLIMMARHSHQMNTIAHVIVDPSRGTVTPFSSPDTTSTSTVWSPDDRRVVYSLLRDGAFDLYIKDIKAGGSEQRLLHTDAMKAAQSWSPDGKVILFNAVSAETRLDLWAIDAVPGATPRIVVGGEADQCCGRFSPNGEWIAYVSNESGRAEVFVRPTKGEAEPIRISSNGGGAPEWRSSGGELYFINPENRVMSVPVKVSAGHLTASAPSPLFQITSRLKPAVRLLASDDRPYATVGDRFLITENEVDPRGSTINLLLNWSAPARQ